MTQLKKAQITILAMSSLTVMVGAAVAPALPQIMDHFTDVSWAAAGVPLVVTMPGLFIALCSFFAGKLLDKYGRVHLSKIAILIYAFAGLSALLIDQLWAILAFRALLGVSVAFIMPAATSLIGDLMEGEPLKRFIGLQAGFMALGGTVLVTLAGLLSDVSWRAPFVVYGVALLVLLLVYVYLKEPERSVTSTHIGRVPTAAYYVYIIALLGMVLFYVIPVHSPFLYRSLGASSGLEQTSGLIVFTICSAISSMRFQVYKRWMTDTQIFTFCFTGMGLGLLLLWPAANMWQATGAMIIIGIAGGTLFPCGNNLLIQLSGADNRATLLGGMVSAAFLGQFLSPLLTVPVVESIDLNAAHGWLGALSFLIALTIMLTLSARLPIEKSH